MRGVHVCAASLRDRVTPASVSGRPRGATGRRFGGWRRSAIRYARAQHERNPVREPGTRARRRPEAALPRRRPRDHDRLHDHGQQQRRRRFVGFHEPRRVEWPDPHRSRLSDVRVRDGDLGGVCHRKQAGARGDAGAARPAHGAAGGDPVRARHRRQQFPVLRGRAHALLRRAAAHRRLLSSRCRSSICGSLAPGRSRRRW